MFDVSLPTIGILSGALLFGLAVISAPMRWVSGALFLMTGLMSATTGFLALQEINQLRSGLGWLQILLAFVPEVEEGTRTAQMAVVLGLGCAALGFVLVMWAAASTRQQPVPTAIATAASPAEEVALPKASNAVPIIALVGLVLVGVFAFGLTWRPPTNEVGLGAILAPAQVKPVIIRDGVERAPKIGDYRIVVWTDVVNQGTSGNVTVEATVRQGTGQWTKRASRYLNGGETARFEVMFSEVSLLGGKYSYSVVAYPTR